MKHPLIDEPARDGSLWRDQALCDRPECDLTSEAWFPKSKAIPDDPRADYRRAIALCNTPCPVKETCAAYGDETGSAYGIYGGLMPSGFRTAADNSDE
jgi:hypothetical protein